MLAEIITIGDEILIGQIVDTNSAFIGKELNKIGISVYQITSVQDEKEHILSALANAQSKVDIVIVTGGLGPTKDDITKHTFCTFFNDVLVENKNVLAHVEMLFSKHISTPISDLNRKQALLLSKAEVLHNAHGTAPGMWIHEGDTTFISLPGVPFEMKNLMKAEVLPKLVAFYERPHIIHRTIVTYGLGESAIAQKIEIWEDELPPFVKLAYLPNLGKVRLIAKGLSLATAESFTGGKIASLLTAMPGASAYFKGSVVSYATETKIKVLNVPEKIIATYSVVSEQVAVAMASGVQELLKTDFAIATTGNAGPAKGDSDAAVGTVCIAIASPNGVVVEKFQMGTHRERIVQKSVNKAFELLQKEIVKM
jgi:nicotinamide-nucleotide amidase